MAMMVPGPVLPPAPKPTARMLAKAVWLPGGGRRVAGEVVTYRTPLTETTTGPARTVKGSHPGGVGVGRQTITNLTCPEAHAGATETLPVAVPCPGSDTSTPRCWTGTQL